MKNKTRKCLFLATALLIFLNSEAQAQEKGIDFQTLLSWEQLKTRAKASNKYIFVDVFATWCATCKAMDNDVYPLHKVGAFMNDKFISVKLQADAPKADNETARVWSKDAKHIMKLYGVSAYPTLLFFSPDGKLVNKSMGGSDANGFITVAANSLDPKKQFYTKLERYKSKRFEFLEMPGLVNEARALGEKALANSIARNYINNYLFHLNESELFVAQHLIFIADFLENGETKAFKFFMKNRERVNAVLGKDKAEYALRHAIGTAYLPKMSTWKTEKPDWNVLEKFVTTKFGALGEEELFGYRMLYAGEMKDWVSYGKYYVLYFEKALQRPEYDINNVTWPIFENVSDRKVLAFACDVVMMYAMKQWYNSDIGAIDTYANLLYKTGRTDKAIEWEEKAVKLSKNDEILVKTLEKMRNNQITWKVNLPD